MSIDLEQLLPEEMQRRAGQTGWRPDLLSRALRRHRRRRLRRRAATAAAAGSLAVALLAVAVAVAPDHTTPTAARAKVETDAYVLRQAKIAVAGASTDVLEVRSRSSDGWSFTTWYDPANGAIRLDVQPAAGRPTFYYAEPRQTVIVDYGTMTWWSRDLANPVLHRPVRLRAQLGRWVRLVPAAIATETMAWGAGGLTAPTPATIRHELADGQFTLIGSQTVHGQRLLELRGGYWFGQHTASGKDVLTLWVSAATYLPVRSIADDALGGGASSPPLYSQFSWLPPTAANLAALRPAIPAGFTQQAPSCPCG